jgi:hypothetical protein
MIYLVLPVCMHHTYTPVRNCHKVLLHGVNVFEHDVMLLCRNKEPPWTAVVPSALWAPLLAAAEHEQMGELTSLQHAGAGCCQQSRRRR